MVICGNKVQCVVGIRVRNILLHGPRYVNVEAQVIYYILNILRGEMWSSPNSSDTPGKYECLRFIFVGD